MILRADFHIHSCLSPCGGLDMSPSAIAGRAKACGLDAIAIADHNTARHARTFADACAAAGLRALYGTETTTAEEAHVLCLFDDVERAFGFGEWTYSRLPDIACRPERMGDQPVVNSLDEIEQMLDVYLGAATDIPLTDLCGEVLSRGGLFIPSHIDRPVTSLLSQLGRIPDLPYDAVEISPHYDRRGDPARIRGRYALLRSSDSHRLDEIGRGWTDLELDEFSVPGIRDALRRLAAAQTSAPDTGLPPPLAA